MFANALARRSLVLAYVHFEAVKDTTVKWQNTVKVYWVTAHVVISMDRMYNGRAATMMLPDRLWVGSLLQPYTDGQRRNFNGCGH